jgi:hypothetical protein
MNPEAIEIVLTELLEEQKQETLANGEIIAILKRILEKVEKVELQIPTDSGPTITERIRAIQLTCKEISERKILLQKGLSDSISENFPIKAVTRHRYYRRIVFFATFFFLLSVLLIWLYIGKCNQANHYKINDLKHRYIKAHSTSSLKKIFALTDSLYLVSPDSMAKSVAEGERRLAQ